MPPPSPKPQPLAIGYPRQSKTLADEIANGQSLSTETQIEKQRTYALLRDFTFEEEITAACTDLDTSSKARASDRRRGTPSWQKRPGLGRLYELAKQRAYQHLIVYDLYRLGRNAAELHEIRQAFLDEQVVIHFVSEGIRTDQDTGELLFSVLAGVAQMEQRNISRRVGDANRQRARRGLPHGRPPAWIDLNPDIPTGDPARFTLNEYAATMRRLVALRTNGLSCVAIARKLNEDGFTTVNGLPWTQVRVRTTLRPHTRLAMRGFFVYGRFLDDDDPNRVVTPNVYPPLLTPEEAAALDTMHMALAANREEIFGETPKRRAPRMIQETTSLAAGLLRCACCGGPMRSAVASGSYRQYICSQAVLCPHPTRSGKADTSQMAIGQGHVDSSLVYALMAIAPRLPAPDQAPKKRKQADAAKRPPGIRSKKQIQDDIDALVALAGKIKEADLQRRYDKLDEERTKLLKWEEEQRRESEEQRGYEMIRAAFATGMPADEAIEPQTLRAIFRLLCDRIELPIILDGVRALYNRGVARKRTHRLKTALTWHARLILKQPLPDGSRSVLVGIYRQTYAGPRSIVFETEDTIDTPSEAS